MSDTSEQLDAARCLELYQNGWEAWREWQPTAPSIGTSAYARWYERGYYDRDKLEHTNRKAAALDTYRNEPGQTVRYMWRGMIMELRK